MNIHLPDLCSIKEFSPDDKANIAVSIAVQPDGSHLVISRFGDNVWDFYPYIPQENRAPSNKLIDWRIALPDGLMLTHPKHAYLLNSSKDFIWSLFTDPVEGRKRPSMQTLIHRVSDLKCLLRWMVSNSLTCFADLANRTLDYVPFARLLDNGKQASPNMISSRLSAVEYLYHQRHKLIDALHTHPWPHETAWSLTGSSRSGANLKPKTEVIPDAVARQLINAALSYVQSRSMDIIESLISTEQAANAKATAGCISATTLAIARTSASRIAGYKGYYDLTKESIRLRTACYIIIDMFSGLRDSEVLSLQEGCITHDRSKDDTTDIIWLHGTIYKTGMRKKRWLVPPIVAEAIAVLTRLTAPLREMLRQEEILLTDQISSGNGMERAQLLRRLSTVTKHKNCLFLSTSGKNAHGISVVCGTTMNRQLRHFCIDIGLPETGEDLYLVNAHQFRRTYAHFMARSELGDLLTLRDHFGHWSINMTSYYADGGADLYEADTEMLEMIAQEKMDRQSEIMGGYLSSTTPLANGGHWLKQWRTSVRTAANKEELIKEYSGTITLNGTGHSWCVGNARGTGCGGLCIFEAQMCVDCNYGIIGQEHRPVWQGILDQQKEALSLEDMGPGGQARAQTILNYAEKVLRLLDGKEAA